MERTSTRNAGVIAALLVVVVAAVLLAGCSSGSAPAAAPQGSIAAQQQATAAPLAGYSLTVTGLGLTNAPLVPLGTNPDHTIQVPPLSQPREVGVYAKGPMPGAPGPAVILGHINAGGTDGAFAHLDSLEVGDRAVATRPDGSSVTFAVYRTESVPKSSFPTAQVYSDVPGPELRLISCDGALDQSAHNYLGQRIVWLKKV